MLKRMFNTNKKASDYTVVVVEDDPSTSLLIVGLLEEEGYIVRVANNGGDALKMLDAEALPNVFVIDLMMPDMSGKQFLEKARMRVGHTAFPPTLLLTASLDGEATANEIEVQDFLPKPFKAEDLLHRVRTLAEGSS